MNGIKNWPFFDQMIVESSHVNKYSLFRSFSSCSWRENVETIHFRTSSGTSLPPSSTLPSWFNCMLENNRFLNFNRCYFFENSSIKKIRLEIVKKTRNPPISFFLVENSPILFEKLVKSQNLFGQNKPILVNNYQTQVFNAYNQNDRDFDPK